MKQKASKADKKQNSPQENLFEFLGLLHEISTSPRVLEFCTPGHKGGRGFVAMLSVQQADLLLTVPEEVG